jgi:cell division septation protein DedD
MISVLRQMERPAPQETTPPAMPQAVPQGTEEQGEFELVMGRGQVASTMLLVLVLLVVFSAGAYVVGKSASPGSSSRSAVQAAAAPQIPPAQPEATPVAKPEALLSADLSAPVYGEQEQGKVYLQVGAVERGLAGIWAEGLRTHGLQAFVAPGPSEKMWRVVIGPLPNPDAYHQAKALLDQLGIDTFGRKQQ